MTNFALTNLFFTLSIMRALPASRSLALGEGAFLLATGTDAASENWAYVPTRGLTSQTVRQVVSFFGPLPFIWPILPSAGPDYAQTLEESGLARRGSLLAMECLRRPLNETGKDAILLTFERVSTLEEAALWAEAAWRAFDSPPDAPQAFVCLAQGLAQNDAFRLVTAYREGLPVGTYMLSLGGAESSAGVYYFATLPEARRRGVGAAMMDDIFRFAFGGVYSRLTLQATPSGVPFYTACGFEALFKIPVHSFSPDIF